MIQLLKKLVFLVFLFSIFFNVLNTNGQNSTADKTTTIPFTVYETINDSASIQTVLESLHLFKPSKSYTSKTHPKYTYWVKLDFKNTITDDDANRFWYLELREFDYCTLIYLDEQSIIKNKIGRFDGLPETDLLFNKKSISFNKQSLINNRFLFLKIKSVRHFENLNNWSFRFVSKTAEIPNNNYNSWTTIKRLVPGYMFAGICTIMFVLTILFFAYFREKQYLFYAIYVFFLMLYLCGNPLKIYAFLFNNNQFYSYWFYQALQMLINISYVTFILYYLKTKKNYPKLHQAILYIIGFLIVVLILDTICMFTEDFDIHLYLIDFNRFVMILFGILGMTYLIKYAKDKLAYFIVAGSFSYMIGALCHIFLNDYHLMLTGVTLEIIIFAFGLTYKIQKEHKEKLHFEKESSIQKAKALRAQINPHFIFNSLNSIQHLISSNNKISALKYLTKFSRLMRNIMESSMETNVVLKDEIKLLNDYLELEALRFDGVINYAINVDDTIDVDAVEVPLLIIQPFVENAILHGLLPKEGKDKILTISFRQEDPYIICEVDDNGVGRFPKEKVDTFLHKQNKSRGIEVTKKRLQVRNETENDSNQIEIIDKYDDNKNPTGTKVIIRILSE